MISSIWAITLLASCSLMYGMPASPTGFHMTQPGGLKTPMLFLKGDESYNWIEDTDGYTVILEKHTSQITGKDEYLTVYVDYDNSSGDLKPTPLVVGRADPISNGLVRHLQPADEVKKRLCGDFCATENNSLTALADQKTASTGTVRNLVIPLLFKDHQERLQPSKEDLDILFNKKGGDKVLAPTGSIKDYFLLNSNEDLAIDSVVYDWVLLPETEKYYANEKKGISSKIWEALVFALDVADNDPDFPLESFDKNSDGLIDAITFVHSGFGAENGGNDCHDTAQSDRIWSHKWEMKNAYISQSGVQSNKYIISSSLWGLCGSEIAHLAAVAHQVGHTLGLPDLNDGQEGSGIGSFGLMGNSWGFDGSQHYPPVMDPWCKIQLGWANIIDITSSGTYEIEASALNSTAFRIQEGYPREEYLLIENRQPVGFDKLLPHGGLAIWHIDDSVKRVGEPGHPGQLRYPRNNKHYRVSLVQRDGAFDLERGQDDGDDGDLWYGENAELGPSKFKGHGPFPNTDSYKGRINKTKIRILNISESASTMTFDVSFPSKKLDQSHHDAVIFEPGKIKTNIRGTATSDVIAILY
mmetsp:Transcript_17923/g.21957  ORF Transcript_17923/g.21957 Transcript_17923/m.21957 type:complete len:583 (+) Transcript_17923:130-1878(+)